MGSVDPHDDRVARYVVFHHRYDPERHERRNMIEAAYDNGDEMVAHVQQASRALKALKARGAADSREHFFGVHWRPGYHEQVRARRDESRRAARKGWGRTGSPDPGPDPVADDHPRGSRQHPPGDLA